MPREKIEYYGEELSLLAIANKIGTTRETLRKYYEQSGNIYEAEKICKKIIEEKEASLVEYNGERLAIQTIAKIEGIKDAKTLKKYYEQTGSIEEAIQKCKQPKIEYKGELLTLDAIVKREGLNRGTLERQYAKVGNIEEAVKICKEKKEKAEAGKVMYQGEKVTITALERRLGIGKGTLRKYYKQTGDIEEAIKLYHKRGQEVEDSKLEYKGERKFFKEIARDEEVPETTLTRYMEKYGNIEKAVFMAKIQKQKTRKIQIKGESVNLYDLSIILGIKYASLVNMLKKGMTIDEIKEQKQEGGQRKKLKQEYTRLDNGQTLLEYCISNRLNYAFVYRAINTFGKTLEEAVKEYQENGSELPKSWIFEKYGVLLRHLMTSNNLDIQKVVRTMRKEQISMSEAIENCVVRQNAKEQKLDPEWMQEVYGFLSDGNMEEEYEAFKSEFFIEEKEEKCIEKSKKEIQSFQRTLLLYEIAEVIQENLFSQEQLPELLQIYEIQPEEIDTIFLELYSKFQGKVMLGEKQPQMQRRNLLNEITKKWHYLGQEERTRILEDNEITSQELERIEELSSQLIRYKNMLIPKEQGKELGGKY